jgi:hypothetical protein
MVMWRFAADGTFRGPERLTGFQPKGTDGRFIYLEQPEERPSPSATSNRVYAVDSGGPPKPILAPLGRTMRFVTAGATPGFGPILLTARPDPELPERELQERWVAQGASLSPFQGYKEGRWSIPWASLTVFGSGNDITISDLRTKSSVDVLTPPMDDFPGFESVALDRYGWLFVENWGADYAIKLTRQRNGIQVDHVTQYSGVGWLGRTVRFLLGMNKGVRIDERRWSPQCADYSAALRSTFFCKPFQVLRDGKLVDVDGLPSDMDRWKGDATGAKAALIQGPGGRGLYATDGRTSRKLSDDGFHMNTVQDLPASGRTFLASGPHYWEVVGTFPMLRLRAVNFRATDGKEASTRCCLSRFGGDSVRFVSLPGTADVLAFHSTLGIWRLGRDRAQLLWREQESAIDLTSVAEARAWNGTVFLTEDRTPYVIKPCRPKP